MHLELRREHKEDYMKVGEIEVGFLCSLEGIFTSEGSEKSCSKVC